MPSPHRRQSSNDSITFETKTVNYLKELLAEKPRGLRVYYDIGKQMEKLDGSVAGGHNWRKQLGDELGVSDSTLSKCLQFRRRYDDRDVNELESHEVHWAQLSIATAIKNKQKRLRLLKRAKAEGWNERDLQREIQRINGSCRGGGRKRKEKESRGLLADVREMARLSEIWNQFHKEAWTPSKKTKEEVEKVDVGVLQKQLGHLREMAETLQQNAGKVLQSITSLTKLAKKPKPTAGSHT